MAFFQNKNTAVTATTGATLVSSFDTITNYDWNSFLTGTQHVERKQVFQEFVFIILYHTHRKIDGAKFPHNLLYEKVLSYFVKTEVISSSPFSIAVPKNASGTKIFEIENVTAKTVRPVPLLSDRLPELISATEHIAAVNRINRDMSLGKTSMGFFQEVATVFSYFYFTRQLMLINGYNWDYSKNLAGEAPTIINRIGDQVPNRTSIAAGSIDLRSDAIASRINNVSARPYFFNSLLEKMKELGFNLLSPPYSTNVDKIYMAYLVKVLDPYRPMGVKNPIATATHKWLPKLSLSLLQENIEIVPVNPVFKSDNIFIQDLFLTIRNGQGGFPGRNNFYTKITPPPFLSTQALSFPQMEREIKLIYDKFQEVITDAINTESSGMLKILNSDVKIPQHNIILASGAGDTSVALLGIKDLALPLFNYNLDPSGTVLATNFAIHKIDCTKRQVIHLGAFALDLNPGGAVYKNSKLEIYVAPSKTGEAAEKYTFNFGPDTNYLTDISITAEPIPSGSFVTVNDPTRNVVSFIKYVTTTGATLKQPIVVAEYFTDRRDLVFHQYTEEELKVFPKGEALKAFTCTVTSGSRDDTGGGTKITYEELLMLISIYEDESPSAPIIADNVLFAPYTFQLYGTTVPSINQTSYTDLLKETYKQKTLQVIFDFLIEDFTNSTNYVTFLSPVLKGGFVGKFSGTFGPKIISDINYAPKFNHIPIADERNPSNNEKAFYELLKYSHLEIGVKMVGTGPGIEVSIKIISHVSPSIYDDSALNTFYGSGVSDAKTKFKEKSRQAEGGSYNQVLAMLRSFGMLEAVVKKMIQKAANDYAGDMAKLSYITDKIESAWLSTTSSPAIKCIDDPAGTPVLRAQDITLEEYYSLKKPI